MPISVNENGVVKPLGSNILYERQVRYIPWHTTWTALTGETCTSQRRDLFCTITLSFIPSYVLIQRPNCNNIFAQEDSHNSHVALNNWFFEGSSTDMTFFETIILTPVHSRHNMTQDEEDGTWTFSYDISNQSNKTNAIVYFCAELIDNIINCYLNVTSTNVATQISNGVGFGYLNPSYPTGTSQILCFEVEAFGNVQSVAV